jgi:hypothetical protein
MVSDTHKVTRRGDQLIDQILADRVEFGAAATELLREFWNGFPVTELRRLLSASGSAQVFTGVSLASELGQQGRPIFDDVVPLLWHPYEKVRYYAVDFMSVNAGPADRSAIVTVMTLIDDPAASVRYAVVKFLFDVPREVLVALREPPSDPRLDDDAQNIGLALLIEAPDAGDSDRMRIALGSDSPTVRRFAVAAAARLLPLDRSLLEQGAQSSDTDVASFAIRTLSRTRPTTARGRKEN